MAFQPVPTYENPVSVDKRTGKFGFSPVWLSWFLQLSSGNLASVTSHNALTGLQGGAANQYYHLTQAQLNAIPFRNVTAPSGITVTASPFSYHNVDAFDEDVVIQGGTVTKIEFSRDNVAFYDVGLVAGMYRLSIGDYVKVTYTVAPTMTKVPR